MAVSNLHEAAKVLQGAHEAIGKLLTETEPMERATHRARIASDRSDETFERIWAETGYGGFFDRAADLIDLLRTIEGREKEEDARRDDAA